MALCFLCGCGRATDLPKCIPFCSSDNTGGVAHAAIFLEFPTSLAIREYPRASEERQSKDVEGTWASSGVKAIIHPVMRAKNFLLIHVSYMIKSYIIVGSSATDIYTYYNEYKQI